MKVRNRFQAGSALGRFDRLTWQRNVSVLAIELADLKRWASSWALH